MMENMDVIALTRELGKKIQQEEAFTRFHMAKQTADNDPELQKLLEDFGSKRAELSDMSAADKSDPVKTAEVSRAMRRIYGEIMSNQSMINYNDTKKDYDALMNRVNAIIEKSFNGEDPETADYTPECTGSCATCGGCS